MTMPWFESPGPIWNAVVTLPPYSPGLADAPPPSGVHGCFTVICRIDSTRPHGKLVQSGASVLFADCASAAAGIIRTPASTTIGRHLDERGFIRSLRYCVQIEHRVQQRPWDPQRAQPALEDGVDVAGAIDRGECAVHGELEVGIVAPHREPEGFVRKVA